ncbi:MAG: nucleotidyltransferase domain-containing protein [Chloroflexi bacterium]|nr:nucleotidyltransferase domain-containing protein [Chloroflexota bacterium]MYE41108.1 nucleotidyltransferase domain-containing protein [Chloroflexota bacterium]
MLLRNLSSRRGLQGITEVTTDIILPPEQLELVLSLTRAHLPGVEVLAYGSRVRGNPRRYSDLDLVAFTAPGQSLRANDLREAFEESDLPIRVDLFLWDEIPDSFHRQIEQEYAVLQRAGESVATPTY